MYFPCCRPETADLEDLGISTTHQDYPEYQVVRERQGRKSQLEGDYLIDEDEDDFYVDSETRQAYQAPPIQSFGNNRVASRLGGDIYIDDDDIDEGDFQTNSETKAAFATPLEHSRPEVNYADIVYAILYIAIRYIINRTNKKDYENNFFYRLEG